MMGENVNIETLIILAQLFINISEARRGQSQRARTGLTSRKGKDWLDSNPPSKELLKDISANDSLETSKELLNSIKTLQRSEIRD